MDLAVQLIGCFGILASMISFQCKKHNSILLFRTLNEAIFALQYILLGAYTGAAMNIVGGVRNTVFTEQVRRNKKTTVSTVLFCVLFVASGILMWQGPKSILIIVAKSLSTVAYGNKNPAVVRAITFFTCSSWLVYNCCVGSAAGVLCEAFTLVSLVIGIVRLDIMSPKKVKC